ncbi:hypothetical protein ABFV62_31380, partial [Pseudomonas syringae]|uniref:hypothetical protein n=1 Tax=Pseudomonas syringae TaxID=317 RepID=UPI0034D74E10
LRPDDPANNGWEGNANYLKTVKGYGYDRFLMWGIAGLYTNYNAWNYPFYIISPLFRNDTPHSSSTYGGKPVSPKLKSTI